MRGAMKGCAPDYCGNCVDDEPQALFDSIRRFVSIAVARFSPALAHGALHQTRLSSCQGICSSSCLELLSFNRSRLLTIWLLGCSDSTPILRKLVPAPSC